MLIRQEWTCVPHLWTSSGLYEIQSSLG